MLDYFAPITCDTFSLVPGCFSISCKTSVSSVTTCSKGNTGSAVPLFMACIFCGGLGTKDTDSARPLRTRSLSLNHRTWNEGITAVSHLMILSQSRNGCRWEIIYFYYLNRRITVSGNKEINKLNDKHLTILVGILFLSTHLDRPLPKISATFHENSTNCTVILMLFFKPHLLLHTPQLLVLCKLPVKEA